MAQYRKLLDETEYDALAIAQHHEKLATQREARQKAAKRRAMRAKRHRMRLVDDIINRLFGRGWKRGLREHAARTILSEGGNIFKDSSGVPLTQRITKADVPATIKWLSDITGLDLIGGKLPEDGAPLYWLGSTGRKATSGDLDLLVNENVISKDALAERLSQWATEHKLTPKDVVRKSGISVHFLTPIRGDKKNGYVQTDFMFTNDPAWLAFAFSVDPTSAYKGVARNVMLNSLAKSMGLKFNQNAGLMSRESNAMVTSNPDVVAKKLLTPKATRKDLWSVERILAALKNDPKREEKVAAFRDLQQKGDRLVAGAPPIQMEAIGSSDADTPAVWDWSSKKSVGDRPATWKAQFEIGNWVYEVMIYLVFDDYEKMASSNTYRLEFKLKSTVRQASPRDQQTLDEPWSVTGTGNAFKVFTTVGDMLFNPSRGFFTAAPDAEVLFSAKSSEISRQRVYARLLDRIIAHYPQYEGDTMQAKDAKAFGTEWQPNAMVYRIRAKNRQEQMVPVTSELHD